MSLCYRINKRIPPYVLTERIKRCQLSIAYIEDQTLFKGQTTSNCNTNTIHAKKTTYGVK